MEKACKNCEFYNVVEDVNCYYHHMDCEPDNLCDNFALNDGKCRVELATFVAESLQGSCDFHGTSREIIESFNGEEMQIFDDLVYECQCCGWWVERGDEGECCCEEVCFDCSLYNECGCRCMECNEDPCKCGEMEE